jgi:hypothetical protein
VKMNKTEDEEITEEQLSDEEIVNLSEGKTWLKKFTDSPFYNRFNRKPK